MAGGIGSQQDGDERLNITFYSVGGARNYRPPLGLPQTPRAASGPPVAFEKGKKRWSLLHSRFFAGLVGRAKLISKEGK